MKWKSISAPSKKPITDITAVRADTSTGSDLEAAGRTVQRIIGSGIVPVSLELMESFQHLRNRGGSGGDRMPGMPVTIDSHLKTGGHTVAVMHPVQMFERNNAN